MTKPLVFPALYLFVGSKPNDSREWQLRLVHGYGYPEALAMTPLLNLDASLTEQVELPSSGDPRLDTLQSDVGLFYPLNSDTIDLLGELQKGRFRFLRFAPRQLLKLADARSGSRNSPTLGCINFRYSRAGAASLLTAQLQRILTNRVQVQLLDASVQAPNSHLWVMIVFGTVGGTGPGAAVEAAVLVREIARDLNVAVTIVGLGLLPGAFLGASAQRLQANTYAVKKELQAAQSGRLVRAVEYDDTSGLTITQSRAFDLLFLAEDKNAASEQRGQTVASDGLSGLLGMVAHFQFRITYTPVGAALRNRLHDEMADQLAARDEYGLASNFCGFGDAQIYLPEREVRLFAPPHLTQQLTRQMIGEAAEPEAANALLGHFLTGLGIADDALTGLLERLSLGTAPDGFPQPFADQVHARFRRIGQMPLALRRNSINAGLNELAQQLGATLEANAPRVLADMEAHLAAAIRRLEHEAGLTALIQVVEAAARFADERLALLLDDQETYALARKAAQEQKAGAEGNLVNSLEEAQALLRRPVSWWQRLWQQLWGDAEIYIARERSQRQLVRHSADFQQTALDEALLMVEAQRRMQASAVLEPIAQRLRVVADRARGVMAELNEVTAACEDDARRIRQLDFQFQVPVGVCLIRAAPYREADLEWFTDRLLLEASARDTVALVWQRYREAHGELLGQSDLGGLKEHLEALFRERFRASLDLYEEMAARYTPEQIGGYLHHCLRASAEYLRSNSAVNHDNRHYLRLLGAPRDWHAALERWLASAGQTGWFLVDTEDRQRLTFTQVRVGVPMHSLRGNEAEQAAYIQQSQRHSEERLHTEPVLRLQPDLEPFTDANDPRFKAYLLMAAVTGSMAHQQAAYWYQAHTGEWEKMGATPQAAREFLLANQDHLQEIASRFTTAFKARGGASLSGSLLELAAAPNGFADFVDGDALNDLLRGVERLALCYGEAPAPPSGAVP